MAVRLRTRLTLTTAAATLLAAAVLVGGLQLLMSRQSVTDSARILQSRLDAAATTVRFGPDGPRVVEVPSRVLDQELWIYDRTGRRIDGPVPSPRLRASVLAMAGRRNREQVAVGGRFRVGSRPVTRPGTHRVGAVVVGAMDLTPYERSEARGLRLSILLGLSMVVAAAAAAWVAAGSSLHRVGRMARLADDWREHDLSQRFALGPPHDEITELGHTLDEMLNRIGSALLAERRLTDEVAHELRTPLAAVRAEAELALSAPEDRGMTSEALTAIIAGCDRLGASIQTMLTAARSGSVHGDDQVCRLDQTLAALVGEFARAGVEVRIAPVLGTCIAGAPADVVRAAIAPVLDNALHHARSRVDIQVQRRASSLLVVVEDDGQGIAEDGGGRLFEPGWTARPDGTGLGLPLARRLARSVGGDVEAMPGDHGKFMLSLPRR